MSTMLLAVIAQCQVQHGKIIPSFFYFATYSTTLWANEMIAKYEKRGKYMSILHETTYDKYFMVNCLLKLNMARVFYFLIM